MSTAYLLGLAVVAIAILLVLVIRVKMPAFVAMLLVAGATALAGGIAVGEIIPTLTAGMGKTLGSVAIIVGLGAMLGRMIEVSGGAEALARTFTEKLGQHRVVAAVTAAAFVLGIPVFFDVGFIILAPIVFGFAAVAGLSPLRIGMPVAAVLLAVHVVVPPHPGPVAAATTLGTDPGLLTVIGLLACLPMSVVCFVVSQRMNLDRFTLGDSPATEALAAAESGASRGESGRRPPSAGVVLTLILLPLALIMVGTTGAMLLSEDDPLRGVLSFVGAPAFALMVGGAAGLRPHLSLAGMGPRQARGGHGLGAADGCDHHLRHGCRWGVRQRARRDGCRQGARGHAGGVGDAVAAQCLSHRGDVADRPGLGDGRDPHRRGSHAGLGAGRGPQ